MRVRPFDRNNGLPGRPHPSRLFNGTCYLAEIRRFANDFIHAMVFADEFFNMGRVGSGDYKLPPSDHRAAAEVLEELQIGIIRRCDVVDDDVGVVLADERVEIHTTIADFVSESGERDYARLFQRTTEQIDHVCAGIQDDRHCLPSHASFRFWLEKSIDPFIMLNLTQ